MNIPFTLARAVQLHPDRPSFFGPGQTLTYSSFARKAIGFCRGLQEKGLQKGDRLAVLAGNSVDYALAYYGAALGGFILVNLNTRLAPPELKEILEDSGTTLLFAEEGMRSLAEQAVTLLDRENPCRLESLGAWTHRAGGPDQGIALEEDFSDFPGLGLPIDHPAHLYYTSGTTGRPKGVILTHGNVTAHAQAALGELALSDGDTWLHAAPMFHLADAWATFALTLAGGRHVFLPSFQPEAALQAMEDHQVTITNLVPTMLNSLQEARKKHPRDLPHLRALMSGGAPIAPSLVRSLMESFCCDYIQTYGMTETSPYLTLSLLKENLLHLPEEEKFAYKATTGRPFQSVLLRVVDDQGRPVQRNGRQVGEIQVRGATITEGYWNQPDATQAAFTDGWLKTGDLATLNTEGYVNIVDRKKDMIITGGENVYSTEVENVLYAHQDVFEAAVFGTPCEQWGEVVCAAVVLHPGKELQAEELRRHCRDSLAGFKVPRHFRLMKELPKTGSGKISKKTLRQMAAAVEKPSGSQ